MNCVVEKQHLCIVARLELFCVAYKSVKLWDAKVDVQGKCDAEIVEKGGIDPGQKVLRILINTLERKFDESGEDKTCGWRERSARWVGARLRGTELKLKGFESGHH